MTDKTKVGEYVALDLLLPHPKNPRTNDHAVDDIANSIKRFGFTSPIIANADNTILAGHTRFKAARKLGLTTVPVVYVDLSPTDAELLMIADNKLGEKADWNNAMLSELLVDLNESGESLDILGFEEHELESLLVQTGDPSFLDFGFGELGDGDIEDKSQFKENTTTMIIDIPDDHINLLEIKEKISNLCNEYSISYDVK